MQSVALDIPQRVEVPLRYVLKGLPNLEPTYMVYLHVLRMDDGQNLVYYGITRRGWMRRFNEHISSAMKDDSPLLFHRTLREGCNGRLQQIQIALLPNHQSLPARALVGSHHVLCSAGLTEEQALEMEEYLVEKYSFGKPQGLNMIPGGKAGVRYLHKLKVLGIAQKEPLTDEEKETILERYLRANPRKGIPNALIAQRWLDDEYAVRVICAGEKRLSADQVRGIRKAVAAGLEPSAIQRAVGGRNWRQVQRVIDGKTYSRVR